MKKEVDKKEVIKEEEKKKEEFINWLKKKEVRKSISCDNCGSHYVYVLKNGKIACRRCGHRNGSK